MAYLVNKTNGVLIATLLDGQIDRSHAGLALIGKQVTNYGEIQNENFIRLAENFSSSIDPVNPIEGQLWWNSAQDAMQVFDGRVWRPVTGLVVSPEAPTAPRLGDQWWDSANQQYSIYSGTSWVLVGPAFSVKDGKSGLFVETLIDTADISHPVTVIYQSNQRIAIVSRNSFTPRTEVAGFASVNAGVNFSSLADMQYSGTATNSERLGDLLPAQYLRSDVDSVAAGNVAVLGRFLVGENGQLEFDFDSTESSIASRQVGADLVIKVETPTGPKRALTVDGATGLISVSGSPVSPEGIATKGYVDQKDATARQFLSGRISDSAQVTTGLVETLRAEVNAKESDLYLRLAPKESPILSGIPTAPTAVAGNRSQQLANTEFVTRSIAAIDRTKIENNSTSVMATPTSVITVVGSTVVSTATATGITTITRPPGDAGASVATTAFVDRSIKNFVLNSSSYQPTCYVSSSGPNNNTGKDGDFWFQYV